MNVMLAEMAIVAVLCVIPIAAVIFHILDDKEPHP